MGTLRPKYCLENVENSISKHLNFKIFWGECPQTPLGSSHLWHSKSRLPPTFPVWTSTSKLIDSTVVGLDFGLLPTMRRLKLWVGYLNEVQLRP